MPCPLFVETLAMFVRYLTTAVFALLIAACGAPLFADDAAAGAADNSPRYQSLGFLEFPKDVELGEVSAVAVAPTGEVVVLHRGDSPIAVFDAAGKYRRSFGAGMFKVAHGLRFDAAGNLWTTDNGNHVLRRFRLVDGVQTKMIGEENKAGNGNLQFRSPDDLVFGSDGSIYVADAGNGRVVKLTADGDFILAFGKKGKNAGEFATAHGIAIDADDRIYIADRGNKRVQQFSAEGKHLASFDVFKGNPFGLLVVGNELLVTEGDQNKLFHLSLDGKLLHTWPKEIDLQLPHLMSVAKDGTLYVAEVKGKRVQKLSPVKQSTSALSATSDCDDASATNEKNSSIVKMHLSKRSPKPDGSYPLEPTVTEATWDLSKTAFIVCDVWDSHHSLNAVRRETQLLPRMNAVLNSARSRGAMIIHAPSDCMKAYEDHPGRAIARSAPKAANLPADIGVWCKRIDAEDGGVYPIDQTDGGEDDDKAEHAVWLKRLAEIGRKPGSPWLRQNPGIDIVDGDPISDNGVEIWNLLEDRKIENIVLLGVHTNMCVLGRPFGLRQLAKNGKNVVLMRDMTDTMYNPASSPYVSHFCGTELIVQHIEKFVCPTITSVDILGGEEFRFPEDRRHILMLIGDDEYKSEITLPEFADRELRPLGFTVTIIHADPKDRNDFPGLVEALPKADLLLVSARRRTPKKEQLAAVRAHIAAGKPVIGIRTASHAFSLRAGSDTSKLVEEGLDSWLDYDAAVHGGNYQGHHGVGPTTTISLADGAANHPILRGVDLTKFAGIGSLYRTSPLSSDATSLLIGTIPSKDPEPIAWTHLAQPTKEGGPRSRVFYTSLGHEGDFAQKAFCKLLLGGIFWTLEPQYADPSMIDQFLPVAK